MLRALGISVASVTIGSILAMRGSVVLAPSLRRRWGIEKLDKTSDDFWVMPMPLQVEDDRIGPFVSFTEEYIKSFGDARASPTLSA